MLYLGVNGKFNSPNHTIWFSKGYRKNVEEITDSKLLLDDPSIYIQNAAITDPTVAPAGKLTLYVLVVVPNNLLGIDWDEATPKHRQLIIKMLEEKLGIEDLKQLIEIEKIISPKG